MSASTSSSILACVTDFEAVMRRNISAMANDYVSGAAGDEITLAENRLATTGCVSSPGSSSTSLASIPASHCSAIASTSPSCWRRPRITSCSTPKARSRRRRAAPLPPAPRSSSARPRPSPSKTSGARCLTRELWFQLYMQVDRGFTRDLVQRARRPAAGRCASRSIRRCSAPDIARRDPSSRCHPAWSARISPPRLGCQRHHRPGENEIYSACSTRP